MIDVIFTNGPGRYLNPLSVRRFAFGLSLVCCFIPLHAMTRVGDAPQASSQQAKINVILADEGGVLSGFVLWEWSVRRCFAS